ncbi:hypothetical protein [Sphingobium sp.]|uniref:hypothetical protein n=1 Tax=Sphingobium sp. TaxID=1912891 RepID=UPI003B3B6680
MALAAAATAQPHMPHIWGEFGRSGALSRQSELVEIATGGKRRGTAFHYRLRLTIKDGNEVVGMKWADSSWCPAVQTVVHDMLNVTMPFPEPSGSPDASRVMVVDSASYHLKSPTNWPMGDITITSNVGSPLAKRVDGALKQLASCWTDDVEGAG